MSIQYFIDGEPTTANKAKQYFVGQASWRGMDEEEMDALFHRAKRADEDGEDARDHLIEFGVEMIVG